MKPRMQRVRDFYHAVDSRNVEAAVSIFHENVVYERGSRTFRSLDEVRKFYETGRSSTISGGTHSIDEAHERRDTVTIVGSFNGRYADGTEGVVKFVDEFTFNSDLVTQRVTTFPGREI